MKRTLTSLLLLALSLTAQGNEITLNVVVKDKKGVATKGLTAADFEVTDGGAKASGIQVRFVGADETDPARRQRLCVIVFERMDNELRRLSKQAVLDLLKESKSPNHLFAVMMFSNQIAMLQPFTSDRAALQAAVDVATSGVANTRFAEIHAENRKKLEASAASDPLARVQLGMIQNDAVIADDQGPRRTVTFLDSVASGLGLRAGRKALLYINWGIVVPTFIDVAFEAMQARANRYGVSIYPMNAGGVGRGINAQNAISQVNDVQSRPTGTSTENNTATNFFGIDRAVEGLRGDTGANMKVMADNTGGLLMADTNDPKQLMRQMLDDLDNYYEITYDPKIATYDGSLRKVNVKALNKDARVRDRSYYYALRADQLDLLPYEVAMIEKLAATPPPRDLEFRSGAWKLQNSREKLNAVLALEVPFAGMTFKEDAAKGEYFGRLTMLMQVKEPSGKVIQKFSRDLPLRGKLEQLPALKNSSFNFREQVSVPPGRYIVEAVVADQATGKTGARRTAFVGNPPTSAVGLSSVSVIRNFQPNAKDLAADDPFQFQGGRITPTLNTTLKATKGATLALFFTVYPDPAASESPQATVQYIKDGNVAGSANLPLPAAANGRIPYVLSSPLDAMPPGMYEVKVIVKQGAGAVAESVFLTIEP